jgi:hypothetical protein
LQRDGMEESGIDPAAIAHELAALERSIRAVLWGPPNGAA